jgi:hypothetical protein
MNRSRKLRVISTLLTIFCVAVFSTEVLAQKKGGGSSGTFFRIRGLQASSLMIGPVERGVYKQNNQSYDIETVPSGTSGFMVSYGFLGVGRYSVESKVKSNGLYHQYNTDWLDLALVFDLVGNTSGTVGVGQLDKGKAEISNQIEKVTSSTAAGSSWFVMFGLEYKLPLNLDFIGLDFTEILVGYRENQIEFSSYQYESTTLSETDKFVTKQTIFGVGLVF